MPGVSTGEVLATMERLARELPGKDYIDLPVDQTGASPRTRMQQSRAVAGTCRQNPLGVFSRWEWCWCFSCWPACVRASRCPPGGDHGRAHVPFRAPSWRASPSRAWNVNIFVQVGFVVLAGLAAKNAILIVEFARERNREGKSLFDAAVEAARLRLRPIIMTSFAFILGVFRW